MQCDAVLCSIEYGAVQLSRMQCSAIQRSVTSSNTSSNTNLVYIAVLVIVHIMFGRSEAGHSGGTGNDLSEKSQNNIFVVLLLVQCVRIPEGVRMSRVEDRVDLACLHAELGLEGLAWPT